MYDPLEWHNTEILTKLNAVQLIDSSTTPMVLIGIKQAFCQCDHYNHGKEFRNLVFILVKRDSVLNSARFV